MQASAPLIWGWYAAEARACACLVAEGAAVALVVQELHDAFLALRSRLIKRFQRLGIRAYACQEGSCSLPNHLLSAVSCASWVQRFRGFPPALFWSNLSQKGKS